MLTWDEEVKPSAPLPFASGMTSRLMDTPPSTTSHSAQAPVTLRTLDDGAQAPVIPTLPVLAASMLQTSASSMATPM